MSGELTIERDDAKARACALRMGLHQSLSDAVLSKKEEGPHLAASGKRDGRFYRLVLHFAGFQSAHENGWLLMSAPFTPENVAWLRGLALASFGSRPVTFIDTEPSRN